MGEQKPQLIRKKYVVFGCRALLLAFTFEVIIASSRQLLHLGISDFANPAPSPLRPFSIASRDQVVCKGLGSRACASRPLSLAVMSNYDCLIRPDNNNAFFALDAKTDNDLVVHIV
jgi:hypothetical protein